MRNNSYKRVKILMCYMVMLSSLSNPWRWSFSSKQKHNLNANSFLLLLVLILELKITRSWNHFLLYMILLQYWLLLTMYDHTYPDLLRIEYDLVMRIKLVSLNLQKTPQEKFFKKKMEWGNPFLNINYCFCKNQNKIFPKKRSTNTLNP